MIYITGATGHIGNNLVRHFLANNIEFTLLQRQSGKALEDLQVNAIQGDIFSPTFLSHHLRSGDILVHLAGFIDLANRDSATSDRINNLGTRTIVDYCQKNDVRLIYTSSVDCIYREKNDHPIDEPDAFYPERMKSNYAISKARGTAYLLDKIQNEGMNALILYPSAVIGVHDYKPSAAGVEIQKALTRRLLFYIKGGYNFIDVRDCAQAILNAIHDQRTGSYILAGHNSTLVDFYRQILGVIHRKALLIPVPAAIAKLFLFIVPRFSKMMIDTVVDNYAYDNTRMLRDLLPEIRPLPTTIEDTVDWFLTHTHIKHK
ncbi:MAG: NAD-dependent epimerase/dehydratase family protein [Candidatus Izemoplasmatales bacterium]|nr:NAD-dependent epimerase/dehydratase family protein [Candidatus Izemoplasmatales bacterium]MDD5293173.1 NAD-dependent epimerase/dehydratase family protein [Candidatus Izemoplasmatales bacterium]